MKLKLMVLLIQCSVSLSVLCFAIHQLKQENLQKDTAVYYSLITAVMAYWLPSPGQQYGEDEKKE